MTLNNFMEKEYLRKLCQTVFPRSTITIKEISNPFDKGLKALIKEKDTTIQVEFMNKYFAVDRLNSSHLLAESEYVLEVLHEARFKFEGLTPF